MKRWKSLLLAIALIAAAAGFAFVAQRAENRVDAVHHGVTLYMETPLSEEDVQALFEQEHSQEDATAFAVWGELVNQHIWEPDLSRSVKTDVLVLRGNCELILPQTAALSPDDRNGCLIGAQTAWELFGSTDVSGDEICIGSETRSIRGVIQWPEKGVVLTGDRNGIAEGAEMGASFCYDRITISSEKPADGEAFLMRNGLDGAQLRLDYLRGAAWLLELVPGKWSDFSGWKENYKNKIRDVDLMMRVKKHSVEIFYEKQCVALVWNRMLEVVCVCAAVVYLRSFLGIFREIIIWYNGYR